MTDGAVLALVIIVGGLIATLHPGLAVFAGAAIAGALIADC